MRRLLLAAAMFGSATAAQAADMPDFLRGSLTPSAPVTMNWEGWYAGGQASYSSSEIDFSHAPKSLTNFLLRNSVLQDPVSQWALLSKNHAQGTGFGGFVGRNFQWSDVVLGIEANYNYINSLASESTNAMGLGIVNPAGSLPPTGHTYTYNTTLSGNAALQIKDVLTFRGRAGWAAGNFLPYMFGGVAVGRTDVSRSATITYNLQDDYDVPVQTRVGTDLLGNPIIVTNLVHHRDFTNTVAASQAEQRVNNFVVGWIGGLGFEYCLWGNVFVRGEWEYVRFINTKDIAVSMNNARAGIGYKF
ncbi:outer membrane protein [Bradyrhizobium sp.]|jgi:opacity protein-like surface antigen|uniref:outer membrane protein n=1 Tax=Bradyrhizobium sp. TaxID=376 RepID=UPI002E076802|nr:outer membrane beta-barrel protein [Bradyrhizobium sp.]